MTGGNKKANILLVDDDLTILNMYKAKLEQEKYSVETANNGKQAFDLAQTNFFDLILLDIVMDKQDGFTTLHKLKNCLNTKRIPVIMLTNLSNTKDKQQATRLGAAGYFVKAETVPADLIKIVKHVI